MVETRSKKVAERRNNENLPMPGENHIEEEQLQEHIQPDQEEGIVMEAVREVVPAIQPSTFSGREQEDVKAFIKSYKRIARANKWTDSTKLLQLPCYLKGAARNWYETVEEQLETFEDVIAEMERVFTNITHDAQKHFKLSTRY